MSMKDGRQNLAHMLWIGGSPGAGKSSVTRVLTQRLNLWAYYFDWHEAAHTLLRQREPGRFPASIAFARRSMDERWVLPTPQEMAEIVIAAWTERFPLVLADVQTVPSNRPLIVGGPGLFPACVSDVIASPHQAIWLVPTKDFVKQVRHARLPDGMPGTSQPMKALENIIERDILLASFVVDEAHRRGLTVIQIDGSRSIDEIVEQVEGHFGAQRLRTQDIVEFEVPVPDLERFVGQYYRADHRGICIDLQDDQLQLDSGSARLCGQLSRTGPLEFRVEDGPYVGERVVFQENGARMITGIATGPGVFVRQEPPPAA